MLTARHNRYRALVTIYLRMIPSLYISETTGRPEAAVKDLGHWCLVCGRVDRGGAVAAGIASVASAHHRRPN